MSTQILSLVYLKAQLVVRDRPESAGTSLCKMNSALTSGYAGGHMPTQKERMCALCLAKGWVGLAHWSPKAQERCEGLGVTKDKQCNIQLGLAISD